MKSSRQAAKLLCIGIIVLLSFPSTGSAADLLRGMKVDVGPAVIRPSLKANCEYNSNINLKSNDKKGSLVYRLTPGLGLQLLSSEGRTGRLFLKTDINATYKEVEKGDDTWVGNAGGLLRYSLSNMTSLGISHNYTNGDLYGVSSGENFDLHKSTGMIKHQFSPLTAITLSGGRETYDTHLKTGSSMYTDYLEYTGGAGIEQKLTPTTTLNLGGNYQKRTFHDTNLKDFKAYGGSLGILEKITPRITIGASGGYAQRDYKVGEDADEITYGVNLNTILSSFSTLYVNYAHSIQDTFYPKDENILSNPNATDETTANLLNEEYRYIETDGVGMLLVYNFSGKDTVNLGGGYVRSRSDQGLGSSLNQNLKEDSYYGGLGYSRRLTSWMSIDVQGSYGVRSSNIREKYDYYTATGGLKISF